MRVLQVTSSFPRRDGDTSGIFIADLASTLTASGVEVHVIAPHDVDAAADELVDGVHVHRFRYAWPARLEVLAHRGGIMGALRKPNRALLVPSFLVGYFLATLRETKRIRPDVLHAHWWFPGGFVAAIVARLTRTPLVVTLHGTDVHLAERPGLRALARWTLRSADVVGVVSEAMHHEAIARLDVAAGQLAFLRMPVPLSVSQPPSGEAAAELPPPLRLVAVGRLSPEKGFSVLLDALAQLDDVELDLFGDGPLRGELRAQAVRSGARVRFHGARPRREIAAALAGSHALVVPSLREGLGLVALEALAASRPVVASRVGGLVETVADGVDGILVAPGDPDALAGALRKLPLPPPRGAAVARHRPETVAAAHLEAYRRAVRRAHPLRQRRWPARGCR